MTESSSKRDEDRLRDIVEAADAVAKFVAGLDEESFAGDDRTRSAVLYKLMVIDR